MQNLLEVCCGLDVHNKGTVAVCLLKGSINDEKPQKTIRTFSTLIEVFEELKELLEAENCHQVAMERTEIYW